MRRKEIIRPDLNPNVSVDCVIFGFDFQQLKVLLIEREGDFPDEKSRLALPGNLIYDDENLNMAVNRVLKELTGLDNIFLKQIGAFGGVDRISKETDKEWLRSIRAHPDARVITVAYYSLVRISDYWPAASSFAVTANWYNVDEIRDLAFDHYTILKTGLNQLRREISFRPIGFNLMPEKFTLGQLQRMYEAILGRSLDKRNFRRKIMKINILSATDEKEYDVPHKPAQYFKFNEANYKSLVETGFDNFSF